MDIRKKNLPDFVEVDGKRYGIKTDFRWWLSFGKVLEEKNYSLLSDFDVYYETREDSLFADVPLDRQKGLAELLKFYSPPQKYPRKTGGDNTVRALDFEQDSDLIYAAFYEVYGIDLLETDLHWWKFLALFRGLHGTKMNEVMGYRLYDENDRSDYKDFMREMKAAWELEKRLTEEEQKKLDEFESHFS